MLSAILLFLGLKVNGLEVRCLDSKSELCISSTRTVVALIIRNRFWENASKSATKTAQRRFIHTFYLYTEAVVQQALERDSSQLRTVENYFEIRRNTIGVRPSFVVLEFKMDIPDEVMAHPSIVTLANASADMIAICNDLYSYNVE